MSPKNKNKPSDSPSKIDWSKKKIKFSFEYYDAGHKDYCLSNWSNDQILKTLKRLKDINLKNYHELIQGSRVYHFHEIHWEQTIHKSGFTNSAVNKLDPYQFALLSVNKQLARVFGAYYQDTFYIVWFDLNHEIWPVFPKGT